MQQLVPDARKVVLSLAIACLLPVARYQRWSDLQFPLATFVAVLHGHSEVCLCQHA